MLETASSPVTYSLSTAPDSFDPYVCNLSSKFKKIALEELREDDNIRGQALAQFREWIAKHPTIKKCRTDAVFLLRFLRTKKFSVPAACEMLERYLTIRQLHPQWFKRLDIEDKGIDDIISSGYLIPLPQRDAHGRQLILSCAGKFDPYKHTSEEMARTHSLVCEALIDDEESQVAGYTYVNDESGLSMGLISLWSLTEMKTMIKCIQNSTPMRHKETHFMNMPSYANKVIEFCMTVLTDKLKNRVVLHKNLEELKTKVDPKLLPKEYGGTMPMSEMIEIFKEKARKNRAAILALDDMYIEVSKESVNFAGNDDVDMDPGMVGSFRKLQVD
ncbi:clavesin-1 [Bradysia coprophila]|uniref:clavesin-1 n=1 Tax=Bradysia coprophila TaxID=38358 RepID=UPI00187D99F8|nr:clavesin-1 [Bradysia coprophila]